MLKLPPKSRLKKHLTLTKLKKKADALFSIHIRKKYQNAEGIIQCYTCSYSGPINKMQCGHFVSRYYLATRYDERNCRPQCITCNIWRNGRTPEFAEKLTKELGDGIVEELFAKGRELTRNFNYQEIINRYS